MADLYKVALDVQFIDSTSQRHRTLRSRLCALLIGSRNVVLRSTAGTVSSSQSITPINSDILALTRLGQAPAAPWVHVRVCKMAMKRRRESEVGQ